MFTFFSTFSAPNVSTFQAPPETEIETKLKTFKAKVMNVFFFVGKFGPCCLWGG